MLSRRKLTCLDVVGVFTGGGNHFLGQRAVGFDEFWLEARRQAEPVQQVDELGDLCGLRVLGGRVHQLAHAVLGQEECRGSRCDHGPGPRRQDRRAMRRQVGVGVPDGAFLYSQPIQMPDIPATDYLFGVKP